MVILMILTLIQFWPAIFSFGPFSVLADFRPFSNLAGHFQIWPIFTFGRNIYISILKKKFFIFANPNVANERVSIYFLLEVSS